MGLIPNMIPLPTNIVALDPFLLLQEISNLVEHIFQLKAAGILKPCKNFSNITIGNLIDHDILNLPLNFLATYKSVWYWIGIVLPTNKYSAFANVEKVTMHNLFGVMTWLQESILGVLQFTKKYPGELIRRVGREEITRREWDFDINALRFAGRWRC